MNTNPLKAVATPAGIPYVRCCLFTKQHYGGGGFVLIASVLFLYVLMAVGVTAMQHTSVGQKITLNFANAARTREGSDWGRSIISDVLTNHFQYLGWPPPLGTLAASSFSVPGTLFVRSTTATTAQCVLTGTTLPTTLPTLPVSLVINSATGAQLTLDKMTVGLATSILDFNCPDARLVLDTKGDNTNTTAINIYTFPLGVTLDPGSSLAMSAGYEGTGKGSASGGANLVVDIRACGNMDLTLGGRCRSETSASVVTGAQYNLVIR